MARCEDNKESPNSKLEFRLRLIFCSTLHQNKTLNCSKKSSFEEMSSSKTEHLTYNRCVLVSTLWSSWQIAWDTNL